MALHPLGIIFGRSILLGLVVGFGLSSKKGRLLLCGFCAGTAAYVVVAVMLLICLLVAASRFH